MAFGHEKLDVYCAAIEYVGWAYRLCKGMKGHRNAKDQLLRASQADDSDSNPDSDTEEDKRGALIIVSSEFSQMAPISVLMVVS